MLFSGERPIFLASVTSRRKLGMAFSASLLVFDIRMYTIDGGIDIAMRHAVMTVGNVCGAVKNWRGGRRIMAAVKATTIIAGSIATLRGWLTPIRLLFLSLCGL